MDVRKEVLLWGHYKKADGSHAIKIRITHYKDVDYIKTGFDSLPGDWDMENDTSKVTHPEYKKVLRKLDELLEEIEFQIKLAEKSGETLSMKMLKEKVEKPPQKAAVLKKVRILEFFDTVISRLEKKGNVGYANTFKSCKYTIVKLLNEKDIPFSSFSIDLCKKYAQFIDDLKTESTKSYYLRTFYRLWNIGQSEGICNKEFHPKKHIDFQPYKKIRTTKRAISFNYIEEIEKLNFPYESRHFRSQQYAIFIFYTRGINFGDLCKLKRANGSPAKLISFISKGHIASKRSKNKRPYAFELHPKAKKVVETFENYPLQSDDGYVFPILNAQYDTARKVKTRIVTALKDFNDDLEDFEKEIKSPKHITSYTLRHSFATHLRKQKVDISIIQAALGHDTEEQTQVYLEELEDAVVTNEINAALYFILKINPKRLHLL